MVFDEAGALGVPVLATQTTSTDEMIVQSHAGVVCENSQDGITKALLEILTDAHCVADIRSHLARREFTNEAIVEAINQLF